MTVTELVSANPDSDARHIACMAMGVCRDCGAAYRWNGSEVSPDEWVRNALWMEKECPHIAESCRNMKWICDDCAGKIERQLYRKESSNKAAHARFMSLTTFSAFGDTFEKSKVMIEQRNAEQWAKAREWKRNSCAWVYGTRGTGKTFLAHCMLNSAIKDGITVGKLCAVDLVARCDRFDWEPECMKLCSCGCLLVDDIDKGVWGEKSINELWRIVDKRYECRLPTIFTSNFMVSEYAIQMSLKNEANRTTVESLFDRMRISHEFLSIHLNGTSLRKEAIADYDDGQEE